MKSVEIPRDETIAVRVRRLQYADLESREELVEFEKDNPDPTMDLGEPIAFTDFLPMPSQKPVNARSRMVFVRRRAAKINLLLEHPRSIIPNTAESWTEFMSDNWSRILRFARTSKNKGKIHEDIKRQIKGF
jgi:hypothetical protein